MNCELCYLNKATTTIERESVNWEVCKECEHLSSVEEEEEEY